MRANPAATNQRRRVSSRQSAAACRRRRVWLVSKQWQESRSAKQATLRSLLRFSASPRSVY